MISFSLTGNYQHLTMFLQMKRFARYVKPNFLDKDTHWRKNCYIIFIQHKDVVTPRDDINWPNYLNKLQYKP